MDKRIENMDFLILFQNFFCLPVIVFPFIDFGNQDAHDLRIRHILNAVQKIKHISQSEKSPGGCFHRHDHIIGGTEDIDHPCAESRRRVNQNIIISFFFPDCPQTFFQDKLSLHSGKKLIFYLAHQC